MTWVNAACVPDVTTKPLCSESQPCADAATTPGPGSSSSSSGSLDPIDSDAGPIIARCGDGVAEKGEDCDDGNTDDTDGCNVSCKLAGTAPTLTETCPGLDVHVWGSGQTPPTLSTTTIGSGKRTSKLCAENGSVASDGSRSSDRIFHVTAHQTGTLSVTTTNVDYNCYLYAANSCSDPNVDSTSCVNKVDGVGGETLHLSVTSGQAYTILVDGASLNGGTDTSEGKFTVTFAIQ